MNSQKNILLAWFMVFNATFNTISVMAVSFIGGGNIMLYRVHLAWAGFELTTLVVLGTDCIGSPTTIHSRWPLN